MTAVAWVYIFAFVFFSGFWVGAWLWWREWKRAKDSPRMRFLPGLPACIFCGATEPSDVAMCCSDGVDCGVWVKPLGRVLWEWRIRCLPVPR